MLAELMKLYPDAKVLLNVRDPEKWVRCLTQPPNGG